MNMVAQHGAYLAAVRQLYGRSPAEIVTDLRGVIRVLSREVDSWEDGAPTELSLISAETSTDGLRRLLGQLRISMNPPRGAA